MSIVNTQNKRLIIFGSPHANGSSFGLLRDYLYNNPLFANSIFFDCYKTSPHPCIDCGACKEMFKCTFDDLDHIYNNLKDWCEEIIICTPVYNNGLPSPLKAFVDRMQIFFNARFTRNDFSAKGNQKSVVLLLTAGSSSFDKTLIEKALTPCFTIINAKLKSTIILYNTDEYPNKLTFEY